LSLARGNNARRLPESCTALTERVVKLAPSVLYANRYLGEVEISEVKDTQIPKNAEEILFNGARYANREFSRLQPYMTHFDSVLFNVDVVLPDGPDIEPNGNVPVSVNIYNNYHRHLHENSPYNLSLRWILPDGFTVEGGRRAVYLDEASPHDYAPCAKINVKVNAGERVEPVNRIVLEIVAEGRPTAVYVPVVLLG
jgi:hypothetical protein